MGVVGIESRIIKWTRQFLLNRTYQIAIDTTKTFTPRSVLALSGVSKREVLFPILLLCTQVIYTNLWSFNSFMKIFNENISLNFIQ